MLPRAPEWARHVCRGPAVLGLAVLLIAGGLAFPSQLASAAAGPAPVPRPASSPLAQPLPSHPAGVSGPVDGRLFNTSLTGLAGVAYSNRLAVDPGTQTAFSLNTYAGNLVAFSIPTGQPIHSTQLVNPSSLAVISLALDPIHHQLYVSVYTYGTIPAYVLVLDEFALSPVANITSFPGDPSFRPGGLLYDSASAQVLAENLSNVDTAIINTTTNTVTTVVHFSGCLYCIPGGFIDVPDHDYVLLPDRTATVLCINTTVDAVAGGIVSPIAGFIAGVGTYDNKTGYVYVANFSGTGDVEVFDANGTYLAGFSGGPTYASAAAYLWTADVVAFADYNLSYPGAGWEVYAYLGLYGLLTDRYNNPEIPNWEPNYAFGGLYPDITASGSYLLTSGDGNSTVQFRVNTSVGTLTVQQAYAGFANDRYQIVVDPANARYYTIDSDPAGVSAFSLATNGELWHIDLSYDQHAYTYAMNVVFDPTQGYVYATFGSPFVDVYSTQTGAYLTTVFFANPVYSLAVDSVNHRLYVADDYSGGYNITILDTTGNANTLVGTILWNGTYACGMAAVPILDAVAVSACTYGPTTVQLFSGTTFAPLVNFTAGPQVFSALSMDANGSVYATSYVTGNVTVFDPVLGTYGQNWTLGPAFRPAGLSVDLADGFGIVTSSTLATVAIVSLATGQVATSFPVPVPSSAIPDFDTASATFYAPLSYTGQILSVQVVPRPAAPTALTLSPGNGTITARWQASVPSAGYPILNYTVYDATGASGPWTAAVTTSALNATLGGLTNGQTYYVSVRAASAAGVSPASANGSATPLGVPFPPTAVLLGNATASSLTVSWSAPASTQGSPVSNYSVEYSTHAGGPWSTTDAGTSTRTTVGGLNASTTYYVRVVAWNAVGASHPSAEVSAATSPATSGGGGAGFSIGGITLLVLFLVGVAIVIAAVLLLRRRGRAPPATSAPIVAPPPGALGPPPGAAGAPAGDAPPLPPPGSP